MNSEQQFFWVNHNKERHEIEVNTGVLIAAIGGESKRGYREILGQVRKGDLIFACFDQVITHIGIVKSKEARKVDRNGIEHFEVKADFEELQYSINVKEHSKHLISIKRDYLSPINKNGVPQQGAYISEIDLDMASFLMAKANVYFNGITLVDINKGANGRIMNIKRLLSGLNYQDIVASMRCLGQYEPWRYCYRDSTAYDLIYEGNRYPPKLIFGFSARTKLNRPLISDEFSGGEDSEAHEILRSNGFYIEKRSNHSAKPILLSKYNRKEISQLFEPGSKFTVGSGRWGISGIIKLKNETDDLIFIVTIEKPHSGNPYEDSLTDDGLLHWETQKKMDIDSVFVNRLRAHDHNTSNIHLFLRYQEKTDYTYLGLLAYEWYDQFSTEPVRFKWRLLNNQAVKDFKYIQNLRSTLQSQAADEQSEKFDVNAITGELVGFPSAKKSNKISKKGKGNINGELQPDWASADERNRTLGDRGEQLVMKFEEDKLKKLGHFDLAAKIERISLTNCAAGYDIKSFDEQGSEIFIEVKTTKSGLHTPFYISPNELLVSAENKHKYYLYRIHEFDLKKNRYRLYISKGSVGDTFLLQPTNFKAIINS